MFETMINPSIDDLKFVTTTSESSDCTTIINEDDQVNMTIEDTASLSDGLYNNDDSNTIWLQEVCCGCFFVLILSIDYLCAPNAILCSLVSLCLACLFLTSPYSKDGSTSLFAFISNFNGVCVSFFGILVHVHLSGIWSFIQESDFNLKLTLKEIENIKINEFYNITICFILIMIHLLCWIILFLKNFEFEYLGSGKGWLIKPATCSYNEIELSNKIQQKDMNYNIDQKHLLESFDFDEEKTIGV